jgi:hypothetical protein
MNDASAGGQSSNDYVQEAADAEAKEEPEPEGQCERHQLTLPWILCTSVTIISGFPGGSLRL